jgi:hypothetical protein
MSVEVKDAKVNEDDAETCECTRIISSYEEKLRDFSKKHLALANALADSIYADLKNQTAPNEATFEAARVLQILNETKNTLGL